MYSMFTHYKSLENKHGIREKNQLNLVINKSFIINIHTHNDEGYLLQVSNLN